MTHSQACTDLVAHFEGFRANAYLDQNGVPTIGYGRTQNVHMGDTCTRAQALVWLDIDLSEASGAVSRLVKVPLTQNQFDALTSLVYNIGQGHFADSSVLKILNSRKYRSAARAFLFWDRADGKVDPGLVTRRTKEMALFINGTVTV